MDDMYEDPNAEIDPADDRVADEEMAQFRQAASVLQ
jgi:hypothetical protein